MGKHTGFLEYSRTPSLRKPVEERIRDFKEFELIWPDSVLTEQSARCMDCGVPGCHGNNGCPLGNLIPDWNDLVMKGEWFRAKKELHRTNNFPDITGRVCPAPCETNCTLGISDDPVTIKAIERSIIDRAFAENRVIPRPSRNHTWKRVAVVGSGPAGLATAQELVRLGHQVTVFEKNNRLGGLLTYGIPDFKLDPVIVERRVKQLSEEGVEFRSNVNVGHDLKVSQLFSMFDAVVLAGGAEQPRNLPADMPGRDLEGIHLAMDFLTQQNRRNLGEAVSPEQTILATGKRVVILGGGDTGADCLGTAHRQKAREVYQYEILAQPASVKKGSSHEEGGVRRWGVLTKGFSGEKGRLTQLHGVEVEWKASGNNGNRPEMKEIPGTEFTQPVDLVLLAMGFLGPVREGLLSDLGVEFNERGAVKRDVNFMTSVPGVFVAGDMTRGASLVVWAIREGRDAARGVHQYLMQEEELPLGR
ncbi:MAG: glutamate synthase subunit beta [Deltaproteobacteria bacterium]|nr:glutamate synthase subunit beta [Deltaproteobacteria bacterium]